MRNTPVISTPIVADEEEILPEVSVVMPCLNEAETLATCIQEAKEAMVMAGIDGEIVIADNGSTDGSQQIARGLGARVVSVPARGYGSALRGGIEASFGRYVIMGDADASYNFGHIPRIVEKLRDGNDLVMGNRFLGGIEPGAMPWLHYYIGNPVLTGIGRLFFSCPAGDFHCGLRGFTKVAYERMELSTTGMEFASEMVIKSSLRGMKIVEVPTILRPDGRSRPPHLRSWRDGWRHLRFMLLNSPRWLFAFTGTLLFAPGLLGVGSIAVFERVPFFGTSLNVNSSLAAAMSMIVGYQLLVLGLFARRLGVALGTHPPNTVITAWERRVSLEHGIVAGIVSAVIGLVLLASALMLWRQVDFGPMESRVTVQRVIPGVTLITLGVQTVFSSFLLSIIGLIPRPIDRPARPNHPRLRQ